MFKVTEMSLSLLNDLHRDAERYRYLRDAENWGEDSGVDSWGFLGESTSNEFDHIVNELLQIIKPCVYEFQTKKDHKFFVELFDHYIMYAASMDSSSHPDDVAIDKKLMKSAYRIMKTMLVYDNLHYLMELHKMIKRFGVEIGAQIFLEVHQ